MLIFPNAKINIGLNITKKRKDGFHNLETVFYPVNLCDILEFTKSEKKTSFTVTGLEINIPDEDNLILKAFNLLKNDFKLPDLNIHLHKIIPFGAGLGGGSSDAAFMLKSLNNYFNLKLTNKNLESYAQKLGSDCPFFIQNKPVFAEGTGNIFHQTDLDLSNYFIAIVKPNFNISTKEAFSGITPEKPETSLKELIKLPVTKWKYVISNDFEKTVFKQYPEIKILKNILFEKGALYAQMSGSGSSVFAVFDFEPELSFLNRNNFVFIQKPLE
ncbi:MAG: 4-(cytidine 5'-diphospho)-2-C-methyl-D-erythritol kinase [Chlorobi bacterium]|nr:4-(cytidine 5'-diphospho)-2-C-methyl-D-erythritol kinase [Chlorobiota bacterium]